ncbi:hypothetical protein B7W85_20935 [Allorhizobium ampelinum]|nr:4'-phosphopantetheinyl transferase superfamily protein [Allorhizobium ampelinum]OVE90914.1 hypothetical protein B7W85_20935 [Allorhizobium ampelinum]
MSQRANNQVEIYSSCPVPPLFEAFISHRAVCFRHEDFTPEAAMELGVPLPESMGKAVAKRKAEYVGGRFCAMEAIAAQTGQPAAPVTAGPRGEPVWPPGLVGSITHTHGFAAAAVADAARFRSLGMDTEQIMTAQVMGNVRERICGPEDRFGASRSLLPELHTTLVFSAKESLFKCLYPLVEKMFWFEDALIRIDPDRDGLFTAELLSRLHVEFPAGTVIEGRFCLTPGLVHTGISLAKDEAAL